MRVYEEYQDAKEKRAAQVGAKRGTPTGKARGYCVVFNENGVRFYNTGKDLQWDGAGTVFDDTPQGCTVMQAGGTASTGISVSYLREKCRRVAFNKLPGDWKRHLGQYK